MQKKKSSTYIVKVSIRNQNLGRYLGRWVRAVSLTLVYFIISFAALLKTWLYINIYIYILIAIYNI